MYSTSPKAWGNFSPSSPCNVCVCVCGWRCISFQRGLLPLYTPVRYKPTQPAECFFPHNGILEGTLHNHCAIHLSITHNMRPDFDKLSGRVAPQSLQSVPVNAAVIGLKWGDEACLLVTDWPDEGLNYLWETTFANFWAFRFEWVWYSRHNLYKHFYHF